MTSLWIDEGVEDICIVRMDEKGCVRGKVLLVAYRIKTRSQELLYYGLVLIVSTHGRQGVFSSFVQFQSPVSSKESGCGRWMVGGGWSNAAGHRVVGRAMLCP